MIALALIITALLGAAWRRWWGSERPGWAFPGYRGMQAIAGAVVLWLAGANMVFAVAAIAFMASPIKYTRRPFEWVTERLPLPTTKNDWLNGPAPWAEALQGATLWFSAFCFSSFL